MPVKKVHPQKDGNRMHEYSADEILHFVRTKKSDYWSRVRKERPLKLFHDAAHRVPAYKDFLKKNKIDPSKIKTFEDFQLVPPVSKQNYLRQYPLEKLVWDGSLEKPLVYTATSGSTGEPFYFPRGERLDWEYSLLAELYLQNSSYGKEKSTLVIVGFGMGVWIGGLITYKAFEIASRRSNLPVSIITPGINKPEIFHALKKLAPNYDQTILIGYPPFIKDVIDEAPNAGVDFRKLNIRLLFAAESFTERFRTYLAQKTKLENMHVDTLNIYGTADIGAMAFETPASILSRRLALKSKKAFEALFDGIERTPTVAQYNPLFVTFEAVERRILLSGDNTIPLIRYAVGDSGGVYDFKDVEHKFESSGINFSREAKHAKIGTPWEMPFVYVYEREDFSTKLYGAIMYPEHIREALQSQKARLHVTGKFTMLTQFDSHENQFLEINIELKNGTKPTKEYTALLQKLIVSNLLKKNAEYRNNHTFIPHKVTPKLIFWPYEHPTYFKPGVKQRWVKKDVTQ